MNRTALILGVILACSTQMAMSAATAEQKEAQAGRDKPLLRCDHLADKAQIDCLTKARERVVAARQKRESTGETQSEQKKTDLAPKADQPKAEAQRKGGSQTNGDSQKRP